MTILSKYLHSRPLVSTVTHNIFPRISHHCNFSWVPQLPFLSSCKTNKAMACKYFTIYLLKLHHLIILMEIGSRHRDLLAVLNILVYNNTSQTDIWNVNFTIFLNIINIISMCHHQFNLCLKWCVENPRVKKAL